MQVMNCGAAVATMWFFQGRGFLAGNDGILKQASIARKRARAASRLHSWTECVLLKRSVVGRHQHVEHAVHGKISYFARCFAVHVCIVTLILAASRVHCNTVLDNIP